MVQHIDFTTELINFVSDLNNKFIIVYVLVIYGIKYNDEFEWYNDLFTNRNKLQSLKIWIAGWIIMVIFGIFCYFEGDLTPQYLSTLMRTWIVIISLADVVVKLMKRHLKTTKK
jgi:hypothetical protein